MSTEHDYCNKFHLHLFRKTYDILSPTKMWLASEGGKIMDLTRGRYNCKDKVSEEEFGWWSTHKHCIAVWTCVAAATTHSVSVSFTLKKALLTGVQYTWANAKWVTKLITLLNDVRFKDYAAKYHFSRLPCKFGIAHGGTAAVTR